MALFEKYDGRRAELIKKMQTMAEFEKSDESVGQIFAVARQILERPGKRRADIRRSSADIGASGQHG